LNAAEYSALIQTARVLVYFSEYEGFGMPPVEAILAGTCPVFSRLAATTEVMGPAGMPFLNHDFESFRRAMDQSLKIAPNAIEAWRDELLQRHNWGRVVAQLVNTLATVAP
jgi:glycosyltransferase involved in cell wall biosynthesis